MPSIESLLRPVAPDAAPATVILDPRLQGLPDTAHGGSVLGVFLLAAGAGPRARVHGLYRRRVPLGVPLRLARHEAGEGHAFTLSESPDTVLVEGSVTPRPEGDLRPAPPGGGGEPLPVSTSCLACGTDNPVGLQARLVADEAAVWCAWSPRAPFTTEDGRLAPVALTTLLDETAFWLGALATGESGMTTDLAVSLAGPVSLDGPIVVAGSRAAVRPHADDPRYWHTEVAARDGSGRVVATARITFVAVRGAARRLAQGMLRLNPPGVVRRVFPAYVR